MFLVSRSYKCKYSTFKMDVLIKSGSIHFKNSPIVTDIVRWVIVFSCIIVPTCRYSHFHNLALWTDVTSLFLLGMVYTIYNGSVIYYILKSILCLCSIEWHHHAKPRVSWILLTKLVVGGVNFWLQNRSGDENCYCRTLSISLLLRIDQTEVYTYLHSWFPW